MSKLKVDLQAKNPKKGEKDIQYLLDKKLLKVYLGNKKDLDDKKLRSKLSEVDWRAIDAQEIDIASTNGFSKEQKEIIYEMIRLKNYKFEKYKTNGSKKPKASTKKVSFKSKADTKAISNRPKLLNAVEFCRDIVSSNASEINPGAMERFAKQIAAKSSKIRVKVINASQAKKLGMGCLLAVGAESLKNSPVDFHPRLVVLEYDSNGFKKSSKDQEHIALVGKGITFDTGGLCLKPSRYMLDMKSDMGGSAAVLSTFKALSEINIPKKNLKVTGVLALAENGFGGSSYKPGDVLKAMNGKTVQVVDTDAEGRLVLADALSYVSQMRDKPDAIIALATLTGSIVAALGEVAAGAMTNDEEFLARVKKSFDQEGENIWQMPIFDEYKKNLKSEIADLAHCNGRPDASVAALFLKEFVGNVSSKKDAKQIPWLHLDIAGTGFQENDGLFAYKGATGFPVKSLFKFLSS